MIRNKPSKGQLVEGITNGNKIILSRAISLSESSLHADRQLGFEVLKELLHLTGNSIRVAITGPPGAGKSTFIEAIGTLFTTQGTKVAVISVDPSSPITGGAILGDKTRMENLSRNPLAFIRPFSAAGYLGGIAYSTREAILLCEAAGFEIIFIETVGVGPSEFDVVEATDLFLLLVHAGAGDELQAIKKGIMEIPDGIIINKADTDNVQASKRLSNELQGALHLLKKDNIKIFLSSSISNIGIDQVAIFIKDFRSEKQRDIQEKRKKQKIKWLHAILREKLWQAFLRDKKVIDTLAKAEDVVSKEAILPEELAEKILKKFKGK